MGDAVIPETVTIGDTVYTVAELRAGLFSGTAAMTVEISAPGVTIDPAAFDDSIVESVTVSAAVSDYTSVNGALLSSDGSILWRVMPAASGTLTLDGVTSVASGALKGCALENIRLGGLAAVSDNAFAGWSGTVIMPATPPTLLGSNCFGDAASLLVGSGLKAEYILIPGYSAVADRIIENSPEFAEENEEISEITPTVNSTWNYRIVNGSAVITAFLEESGIVTIPADIDGYPVAAIDPEFDAAKVVQFETESSAFAVDEVGVLYTADRSVLVRFPAASALTNYTVPSSAAVAERAFAGAKNLTTVNLYPYSLRNLGANAFADTTDELTVSGGKLTVIITARPLADGVDIETLKKLGLVFEEEPEEEITDDDDDSEAPEEEVEGTEEVTEEETPAEEPAEEASNEETPSEENPSAEEPSEEPAEQE